MNKLIEKFIKTYRKVFSVENLADECEQITDDFSVKFALWLYENCYKLPTISATQELQQYFKDNIYGKE